jgi:hypothetical protein
MLYQLSEEFYRNQIKHLAQLGVAQDLQVARSLACHDSPSFELEQTNDVNSFILAGFFLLLIPTTRPYDLSIYIFDLYRLSKIRAVYYSPHSFPFFSFSSCWTFYTSVIQLSYKLYFTVIASVSQGSPLQQTHRQYEYLNISETLSPIIFDIKRPVPSARDDRLRLRQ